MPAARVAHALCGFALAVGVSLARAQVPAADATMLADWSDWARSAFAAPPPGSLPPQWQEAAARLSQRAAARIDAEAPRWLADLRSRHGPDAAPRTLAVYMSQRLYDEIVRWYLQPLNDTLVGAWIAAATHPRFCPAPSGAGWLSQRASRWALVPPAHQEAVLKAEAEAIERLGAAGPVPARPMPGAIAAAQEMASRMRRGASRPRVPMPPVVAERLLADDPDMVTLLPVLRCAANQWWLRERLAGAGADAGARAAALTAFLVDWAPDVDDFAGRRSDNAKAYEDAPTSNYPRVARQHELTGEVLVRVDADAAGRIERAQVVGRTLSVPGVAGRPLAFETLLDDSALRQARAQKLAPSADGKPVQRTFEFVFKLD